MTRLAETPMSVEEFLRWQETQEERHELVDGRPRLMTGGTRAHRLISRNVLTFLHGALRGKPCQPMDEFAVVTTAGNIRYPDVLVDCGKGQLGDHLATGPTVVIEVASPTSLTTDYLQKPRDYASVPTISTYVILNQDIMRAAVLRRAGSELVLEGEAMGRHGLVDLPEIGVRLSLADVYEGLDLKE
ncbi:conserved hypothetical protein [uncultured Pleomorphomonas sp.]|uniref:Putative restriction endonuclease domain-containing protein n=1 Tax=uncultured Pleomorphomonas sp. TaxID=442121 RepID=A0A212LL60_9HYPH|nr:Uma2 family endonuclease [uncultured Pleomorphomonas sp.]SCM78285.1 conserved hypothetical protein [uncultured Pleomorphomonas sp.]